MDGCNPFNNVETYCILFSIPIIYILYTSSKIRKEFTKREKDIKYCTNDIMEGETLRDYLNTPEYKSLKKEIDVANGIFFGSICIFCVIVTLVGIPSYMNINSIEAFIILVILVILSIFLFIQQNKIIDNTTDYNEIINKYKINIADQSFANFPEAFKKPFIERWLSLQKTTDVLFTSRDIIKEIDNEILTSPKNIIKYLRPANNYFVENNKVVLKNDTEYLRADKLPSLSEHSYFRQYNDTFAWIILIFLYYNIFHIYYDNVDMFNEITIALVMILIICMLIYYITIAKDEL